MFGIGRKTKEEPHRYDPRVDRPQPAFTPMLRPSGLTHLERHLPALAQLAQRPMPPPDGLVRGQDANLADLLKASSNADGEAGAAAAAWQHYQPGAPGFAAVVDETTRWARRLIAAGKTPPTAEAPLYLHWTRGQAEAYTAAVVAQAKADHQYDVLLRYARSASDLVDRVDKACDELRDEMAEKYAEARDRGDRDLFRDAQRLGPRWLELSSLYEWLLAPDRSWRRRQPDSFPKELTRIEHQAAEAVGETRYEVPIEALGDNVPDVIVTPGTHRESEPVAFNIPTVTKGGQG